MLDYWCQLPSAEVYIARLRYFHIGKQCATAISQSTGMKHNLLLRIIMTTLSVWDNSQPWFRSHIKNSTSNFRALAARWRRVLPFYLKLGKHEGKQLIIPSKDTLSEHQMCRVTQRMLIVRQELHASRVSSPPTVDYSEVFSKSFSKDRVKQIYAIAILNAAAQYRNITRERSSVNHLKAWTQLLHNDDLFVT